MLPTPENLMFTSIDEIVSVAQSNLGMSEPDRNPIMRHWGYEAQRHIGLYHVNEKKEVKNITDLSFDMPCDMVIPIEVKLGDECECESSPNECNKCSFIFYKQERFCPDEHSHNLNMSMSDGKFHLSSNADEHKKATVRYLALPLDDNLMPLIPEYNTRAVTSYIEYMYIKQQRRRNPREIPLSEIQMADTHWLRLKRDAIRNKNSTSPLEFQEIIFSWLNLVPEYKRTNFRRPGRSFF